MLRSRDSTSPLVVGQPVQCVDAGGLCQCAAETLLEAYSMLSLIQRAIFTAKEVEWDSPQLKLDVYETLNELSPPMAHFSLLTLKGNLRTYPGCKHLQHKNLKLGERNLTWESSQ